MCVALPCLAGGVFEGVTQPFRQAELSAPVSSRLVELKVKEGESVKAGQPLAQFYVALEELEMRRAKALLERREFEAKGAKRLYDTKIISESKAVETRIDLELARIQFETAEEQVKLRLLLAPFDGVVVAKHREVGEAVSSAQPILHLVDLSKVLVRLLVPSEQLSGFTVDQAVRVRFPQMPGTTVPGVVSLVDPCADTKGRHRVIVTVDNDKNLIRSGVKAVVEVP